MLGFSHHASFLWTATAMGVLNVSGTVLLKHYAGSDRELLFVGGCGAYCIGAALYVALLQQQPLAIVATVSTILQLGLMLGLSAFYFGEQVNSIQWLGLATGMLALAITLLAAA